MKAFKVSYIVSNHEELMQLTKDTGLRDALLSFPFSPDAESSPHAKERLGVSCCMLTQSLNPKP